MSIETYGNPILRVKTQKVTSFNGRLAGTVEEMKKIMAQSNGVGLSANQVGLDMSLFIAKLGEEIYALTNPVVTPLSLEKDIMEEGCLSIPGVWVDVERFHKVRLQAQDIQGKQVELELEGFPARVVQHEIDHLSGVLIIDRISTKERRRVAEELNEIKKSHKTGE